MAEFLERRRAKKEEAARAAQIAELSKKSRAEGEILLPMLPAGTRFASFLMNVPHKEWSKVASREKRRITMVLTDPTEGIAEIIEDTDENDYHSTKVFRRGELVRLVHGVIIKGEDLPMAFEVAGEEKLNLTGFKVKQVHLPDYKTDMFQGRL